MLVLTCPGIEQITDEATAQVVRTERLDAGLLGALLENPVVRLVGEPLVGPDGAAFVDGQQRQQVEVPTVLSSLDSGGRRGRGTGGMAEAATVMSWWRRIEWQFGVQFSRKRRWRLRDASLPSVYESGAHRQR